MKQGENMFCSVRRKIRVRKQDTAFVYFALESEEGITAYSTLDSKPEDPYRDLLLQIPPDFQREVSDLLIELGDLIYELPS